MNIRDIFIGPDRRLHAGWRVTAFLISFLILILALRNAVDRVAFFLSPGLLAIRIFITLPPLTVLIWVFRRFLDRRSCRSMGLWWGREALPDLGLGLVMGAALVAVVAGALGLFEMVTWAGHPDPTGGESVSAGGLFLALAFFLAAAWLEEIVYRGYVQTNLTESVGPFYSILVTSALFSAMHALNPNVQGVALINLFLAGALLGIVYHRFGTLWAPWTMHAAWNLVMGTVLGVPVSGKEVASVFELELVSSATVDGKVCPEIWHGADFGFEGGLAATLIMLLALVALVAWRGRPARPPEPLNRDRAISRDPPAGGDST